MKLIKRIFIRNLSILVLLFSVNACASFHKEETVVDPTFNDFVTEFKHISKKTDKRHYEDLSIVFSEKDMGDAIGTCYESIFYSKIEISKDFWTYSNYIDKQALIYHELGHCVCNLGHTDISNSGAWYERIIYKIKYWMFGDEEKFKDGCPISWMNSNIVSSDCSYRHFDEYIADIKNRCQQ